MVEKKEEKIMVLEREASDQAKSQIDVLPEKGRCDGMVEKKEEKIMVLKGVASIQAKSQTKKTKSMAWEKDNDQREKVVVDESLALISGLKIGQVGPLDLEIESGPLAMIYDEVKGWSVEKMGLNNRHWKRLAREIKKESKTPLSLLTILAWNHRGMGSALAVRTLADEVRSKDPLLVFLIETKTGKSKMKGIRIKVECTQGIIVPSDGRSRGLAMMWKEGSDIRLKSYSNSNIDVEIHQGSAPTPWRATGFYGHPDAGKRFISWQLLDFLKNQNTMLWIVFGDFNEITQSDEKMEWLD
nr:hypothetical protein CFP56_48157 [Quercus suber]